MLFSAERLTVSGSAEVTAWQFGSSLNEQSSNEYKQRSADFCNLVRRTDYNMYKYLLKWYVFYVFYLQLI